MSDEPIDGPPQREGEGGDGPPQREKERTSRWITLGGLALGLAIGAGAAVLALGPRGPSSPGGPTGGASSTTAAPRSGLAGAAAELFDLLDRGRSSTFHAHYAITATQDPAQARQQAQANGVTIEIWRRRPRVRQDATVITAGRALHSEVLLLPAGAVMCAQQVLGPWTCQPGGQEPVVGPDVMIDAVAGRLSEATVSARDDDVGGRRGRCFHVVLGSQTTDICADKEGIPLLIATDGSRLEMTGLDHTVGDVFTPPAPTGKSSPAGG